MTMIQHNGMAPIKWTSKSSCMLRRDYW